jgi:hypothetical protein
MCLCQLGSTVAVPYTVACTVGLAAASPAASNIGEPVFSDEVKLEAEADAAAVASALVVELLGEGAACCSPSDGVAAAEADAITEWTGAQCVERRGRAGLCPRGRECAAIAFN